MKTRLIKTTLLAATLISSSAIAGHHNESEMKQGVMANDQSTMHGTVSAEEVHAAANGWLVVHRTDKNMKPGPVVGHAPLKKGVNKDVASILTETVKSGEMLMLMVHSEAGGNKTGIFEYTLGAKEDGPVKIDGKLVMKVITAK